MTGEPTGRCGWASTLRDFVSAKSSVVCEALADYVCDVDESQRRAWRKDIPVLQRESDELLDRSQNARSMSVILEYTLPRDFRRPDVVFLNGEAVVVVEMKGASSARQAHIDQVRGYVRDLSMYHAACHDRKVSPVLVPTSACDLNEQQQGVRVVSPENLDGVLEELGCRVAPSRTFPLSEFLDDNSYEPMPGLIMAARELFRTHKLPFIKRARAKTDPCINYISDLARNAAQQGGRHLVLVHGVPGAGKTLVGLRLAYAGFLDDLVVERAGRKNASPAVFLSGNAPLVEVLRYALRGENADSHVFVQDVKKYVQAHTRAQSVIPPEHVLVFDEAQRAWDAARVQAAHRHLREEDKGKSEPDLFIEFAERIPEWCLIVGLIGGGQEIHNGEEAGIGQWAEAIDRLPDSSSWTVHTPGEVAQVFTDAGLKVKPNDCLSLNSELRFHLLPKVQQFVAAIVDHADARKASQLGADLEVAGYTFLVTRDLELAKAYLVERYGYDRMKRYGMVASSRDKALSKFGIMNKFQDVRALKVGPWYNADPGDDVSCCQLNTVATEFYCQGLELDCALLGWGTDFVLLDGQWSTSRATQSRDPMRDFDQVRKNAYRVLLTRGRDGTVVFVPPLPELDETYGFLAQCGWRLLEPIRTSQSGIAASPA